LGYIYTAALNLPIQGAAAEITLSALTRIASFICEDCQLVKVIHDEILLEVKEGRAEEFAEKAKLAMEEAFLDVFPNAKPYLKGLVEFGIGKNWAETK
jgi:DNA polymerase I-like protein with 3'-5' exonuclease and polymerase domains